MSRANLTPWFRCANAKPSRVGWYDVKYSHDDRAHYRRYWWDGRVWRFKSNGIMTCFGNSAYGKVANDSWRGRVEP